jgi:hypothetical protein
MMYVSQRLFCFFPRQVELAFYFGRPDRLVQDRCLFLAGLIIARSLVGMKHSVSRCCSLQSEILVEQTTSKQAKQFRGVYTHVLVEEVCHFEEEDRVSAL